VHFLTAANLATGCANNGTGERNNVLNYFRSTPDRATDALEREVQNAALPQSSIFSSQDGSRHRVVERRRGLINIAYPGGRVVRVPVAADEVAVPRAASACCGGR
jgi:hypothetical protein